MKRPTAKRRRQLIRLFRPGSWMPKALPAVPSRADGLQNAGSTVLRLIASQQLLGRGRADVEMRAAARLLPPRVRNINGGLTLHC